MGYDTPWKPTQVGKAFELASSLDASHPSPLVREPFARAGRTQDTVLAGRRLLVSQHMGGCDEWLVDNTPTGGGGQTKPEANAWRVVCRAATEMMPGHVLVARVVAVPSGATEGGSMWANTGNGGAVRFEIDWRNVDDDEASEVVQFELSASEDEDGAEDPAAGAAWAQLQHHVAPIVQPAAAANSQEETARWSEWPSVSVRVGHRGGARVVHASLCEAASLHVVAHDDTNTTCNGTPASLVLLDTYPVDETADGATYEDHRFGTHQMLRVAARQSQRVGARGCHWSAFSEELTEVTDTEADPIQITSSTPVRVSWRDPNANTEWDPDAPGFDILATRRAPAMSGAAVSPVRVRVYARFTAAGSHVGTVRLQSSPRSWVDVTIPQADVGTDWQWVEAVGFLESNIASDDAYAIVQDFAWTSGGTLEIRYFDVGYGDYPV